MGPLGSSHVDSVDSRDSEPCTQSHYRSHYQNVSTQLLLISDTKHLNLRVSSLAHFFKSAPMSSFLKLRCAAAVSLLLLLLRPLLPFRYVPDRGSHLPMLVILCAAAPANLSVRA
jgi:hypothetical protein